MLPCRYGVHLGRTIARGTPSNLTLGNFDCHGDYKNLEERGAHSGNGFSFLNTIGILKVCVECAHIGILKVCVECAHICILKVCVECECACFLKVCVKCFCVHFQGVCRMCTHVQL